MMKILHTSDWHLGQTFYDYDRTAEQQDMLRQITEVVRNEQPDAMVVCGDVFHTGNPSSKAVEMYNRALLEMHEACPTMQIVVTAGNHDSASRLVVNNDLWDYFRVTVVGNIARKQDSNRTPDYERHIVTVCGNNGVAKGFIAAVPHCYESNFPAENPDLQREERMAAYFHGLSERIKEQNPGGLPVVLMAHLAVSGSDFSGHDNIGGMETRDLAVFGNGYDYVALGHIHTPQDVSERVRYCGTPIPVNFGERFEHSVSIVNLETGEKPVVKTHKIRNIIPLHDFPATPHPFAEVLEKIKDYPADELCYLRLMIKVDETMTPLADTLVAEAIKEKLCRVCRIQTFCEEAPSSQSKTTTVSLTGIELKTKTPLEVAEMFFKMKGIKISDRQREMIQQATIIAEQNKKEDNNEA